MEKEKTRLEDVSRALYDIKNPDEFQFKTASGLTAEIVREISSQKNEPEWMLNLRKHLTSLMHKNEADFGKVLRYGS